MYYRQLKPEEVYHLSHGGPGSGRYPLGSGDRPYQHRYQKRLKRYLDRADIKTKKLQIKADKKLDKANRQRNSIFRFRRESSKGTFQEGYNMIEKRERIEYKAAKKYEKYLKNFDKHDLKMDKELKAHGLEYLKRMQNNMDTQYKAAMLKRIP